MVLLCLRDAFAVHLAPAHPLSEGEADDCLLVESEGEGRAERGELVLAREAGEPRALTPAAVGLGGVCNDRWDCGCGCGRERLVGAEAGPVGSRRDRAEVVDDTRH